MGTVQFLDHKLQFVGTQIIVGPPKVVNAIVKMLYTGNTDDDAARGWFVLQPDTRVYLDRHNNNYATANHDPSNGPIRTSYVEYSNGKFIIGKELRQGDTFYVNAVRYDVPAIEVLDTDDDKSADSFKFITLRTKLPKGTGYVQDESVVSSQDIDTISPVEIIPILPPFNDEHDMIDDVDIPLWTNATAERYWTMQNPPNETVGNFDAFLEVEDRLDTDSDDNWIAYDVSERIIEGVNATKIFYIDETIEKRLSTNLLEKLNEMSGDPVYENWKMLDVQTLPDQYTEFILPEMPDYYTVPREDGDDWPVDLDGDYLITTSLIAPVAAGDLYDNKTRGIIPAVPGELRVAFSYDPVDGLNGTDVYVNNYPNDVNTVRIYGLGNASMSAPDVYDNWEQPFNPAVIRKDSITFDPAILERNPSYSMSAQNENCDLKEYLRAWYVPEFDFFGEHCNGDTEPAIVTETTYMLIDSQDKKPWHGEAGTTWFAFPIVADPAKPQIGLDSFENPGLGAMSAMENLVQLIYVNGSVADLEASPLNKTTNGTIRIEKTYILDVGDEIQFIDHKLRFEGYDVSEFNNIDVWYAGNKNDAENALVNNITLPTNTTFFDRHNNQYRYPDNTAKHANPYLRTWYARFNAPLSDGRAMITVGKELHQGDIFYVDGVRYEIPAIEVLDWNGTVSDGAEKFKFITLRTPYPKYISGDEDMLDECADGGSRGTSSQYIVKIHSCNPIPVLPPLNMEHAIVDDTDVVLWQPLQHLNMWPYGDPKDPTNYFKFGERYLTMKRPGLSGSPSDIEAMAKWIAWAWYFRVIPIDTDNDIIGYDTCEDWAIPKDPEFWDSEIAYAAWMVTFLNEGIPGIGPISEIPMPELQEHWIANDVNERIIGPIEPLEFCWKSEDVEPRYSTNLLEILTESNIGTPDIKENWTKYDIQTLPDEYTEFKLPVIPSLNPICYVGGDIRVDFEPDIRDYPGSYLITTSFIAPNAKGDLNLNQTYSGFYDVANRSRFAFTYNASDGTGIYMNENVTIPIPPEGDSFVIVLDQGANYVSLPIMPSSKDPKAIFGPEVNVWGYDAGTGVWAPTSAVAKGKGYYAYAPKPKTVTVYGTGVSLPAWSDIETANPWTSGWNLVGTGNTSVDVPPSGVQILRYSKAMHDFLPVPPSDKLEPGAGYWAFK
ncbi:MAG: hypothetical protein CHKLHMKO_00526 [Candidatus Argoarchaeum ethanivorans]|uniref:Uncharacterized protein n=1 Tax=Candidatus Argoarchaeum ethanivorans TaxID=2608793 RepID=A0A811TGU5_9EURY|nr:MAG: hypothetical protein CHKLHMKO_00526 [Candidatus Argoarchaeum ethanivorans]